MWPTPCVFSSGNASTPICNVLHVFATQKVKAKFWNCPQWYAKSIAWTLDPMVCPLQKLPPTNHVLQTSGTSPSDRGSAWFSHVLWLLRRFLLFDESARASSASSMMLSPSSWLPQILRAWVMWRYSGRICPHRFTKTHNAWVCPSLV